MADAVLLICTLLLFLPGSCLGNNDRPIIGILTVPTENDPLSRYGYTYLASSYVKFIESGGARVVPIFHNSTTAQLQKLFSSINGVMFPGGGATLTSDTDIYKSGSYLLQLAVQANQAGDYFPILGHCQGFELLSLLVSQNQNILSRVDAENITLPLSFTPAAKGSRWIGRAPLNVVNILASEPVTMNNHMWSVTPSDFAANAGLSAFFRILSTNQDRNGKQFISTMEGINFPVYGAQWHAEKNQFEWWSQEVINHSADAIEAMQYFSRFFVNEARLSNHHFSTPGEEEAALIYQWSPLYTEDIVSDFEQAYVW